MTHPLLSVQLYTVRTAFESDALGALTRLAEIGYTHVEPYRFNVHEEALLRALGETGLSAPTAHVKLLGQDLHEIFSAAQRLGISTVIDPFAPPERWTNAAEISAVARDLNEAAVVAAEYGIEVGYHNHAHELADAANGGTLLDSLIDQLAPEILIELDTYWVAVAGKDPVAVTTSLSDRLVALHIKDGPGTPETIDQVALGRGIMPIRAIINAAPHALRVVELDDSREDLFTALETSRTFLIAEDLV
ncbi:sugar phosphate isomerase/epimerase family protein [Mycetocola spongiae]|uniref:sugar phosphate isomerase/epimerase family protein n=1 Tax=Mycetocola spongiae TaxID=2859226 RepID=UPI001CF3A866|nr:sugar phosphate isomerase/epimerase [Mycetocola spongiae]UCR88649.1 sugar phosphate isomerase/epimerase [Mycetocola spongiae]